MVLASARRSGCSRWAGSSARWARLIGLLIAVHILNARANTSSANQGRRYDEHSRGQAKMMAALGVLMILLGLCLRVVVMVGSVAG